MIFCQKWLNLKKHKFSLRLRLMSFSYFSLLFCTKGSWGSILFKSNVFYLSKVFTPFFSYCDSPQNHKTNRKCIQNELQHGLHFFLPIRRNRPKSQKNAQSGPKAPSMSFRGLPNGAKMLPKATPRVPKLRFRGTGWTSLHGTCMRCDARCKLNGRLRHDCRALDSERTKVTTLVEAQARRCL